MVPNPTRINLWAQWAVPCVAVDGAAICDYGEKRKAYREILRCAETYDGFDEAMSTAKKARLLPVMSDSLRGEVKCLIHTMLTREEAGLERAESERLTAAFAAPAASSTSWPLAEEMPYSPSMEILLQRFPPAPVASKRSTRSSCSSYDAAPSGGGACTAIIQIAKSDGRSSFCVRKAPVQVSIPYPRTGDKGAVTLRGSIALSRASYFPSDAEDESFVEKFCVGPSLRAATLSEVTQRRVSNRSIASAGQHRLGYSRGRMRYRTRRHRIRRRLKSIYKNRRDARTHLVKRQKTAKQSAQLMSRRIGVRYSLVTMLRLVLLWAVLWLYDDGESKQLATALIREPAVRHDVTAQSIREVQDSRSPTHQVTPEIHFKKPAHQATPEVHSRSPTHKATPEVHSRSPTHKATPEVHSKSPTYAEIARHKPAVPKPPK